MTVAPAAGAARPAPRRATGVRRARDHTCRKIAGPTRWRPRNAGTGSAAGPDLAPAPAEPPERVRAPVRPAPPWAGAAGRSMPAPARAGTRCAGRPAVPPASRTKLPATRGPAPSPAAGTPEAPPGAPSAAGAGERANCCSPPSVVGPRARAGRGPARPARRAAGPQQPARTGHRRRWRPRPGRRRSRRRIRSRAHFFRHNPGRSIRSPAAARDRHTVIIAHGPARAHRRIGNAHREAMFQLRNRQRRRGRLLRRLQFLHGMGGRRGARPASRTRACSRASTGARTRACSRARPASSARACTRASTGLDARAGPAR